MKESRKLFALCIDNTDYKASLILGKVYRIILDPKATKDDFVRIIDEGPG
jgi:CRISPR/Cas system-associated endonuclease Cas1